MEAKRNKSSQSMTAPQPVDVVFGAVDWTLPVFKTVRSFFETPEDSAQFAGFVQEILNEDILLAEVMQREALHARIMQYHFEQVGFFGASVHVFNQRVVLLRIHGALLAVRQTTETAKGSVAAIVEISSLGEGSLLQVLDCDAFLKLWSQTTGNAPEDYNTDSSIQPYLRSLIKAEPLHLHGRSLKVESILGQGLEGTVCRVRDVQTQQSFALKVTYKDLRELYRYWSSGLAKLRQRQPHLLKYLCEFYSCEAEESGSTLLMEYIPAASLQLLGTEDRLARGLQLLADIVCSVQALHQTGICHGDLGVSNVFVRRTADGCSHAVLIDPHPDVCCDFGSHQRKDAFGIAHILYWLVTGRQWPEGTYPYMLKVMAKSHDPAEGSAEGQAIFTDPPLQPANADYANLHAAAIRCLCDLDTFESMVAAIHTTNDRLNRSAIAVSARVSAGLVVTGRDIECKVARALKPIGSGVFMPMFSLPSYYGRKSSDQREYGMGDSGPVAREFVKRLQSMGQRFWLLLPISPTDQGNCPYRTDSSFAINPNILSPEELLADGWITEKDLDRVLPVFERPDRVPLSDQALFSYKRELLNLAFKRCQQKNKASWHASFRSFKSKEAWWLDAYALYKTIEVHHPTRWNQWPEALRDADTAALKQFSEAHCQAIEREKFHQFLAQHYFLKLRHFAEQHSVYMIGDLPAYSMHGSADVWAYRKAFELTHTGERTRVAGAPPDIFDGQGQGWNHPMYRWSEPATLQFLKQKYQRMKSLFADGLVRDDHIIGKVTPWGYTFGQPAAHGHRVAGAFLGNALFDTVREAIPDLSTFLIGEDLGILTTETRRVMQHYRFMGMKVLQFIPFNDGPAAIAENMYTPGNYSAETVILLGTHDAPIIREWWRRALNNAGRYHCSEYLQQHLGITTHAVTDATIAALFTEWAMQQTPHMMIHQVPDIIVNRDGSVGLTDARMNDPGNRQAPDKNWSWRLHPNALNPQTMTRLKQLTELTERTPEKAIRRLKPCWPADAVVLLAVNTLGKIGKASKALIPQLESIVAKESVRYAPLGDDCLSALYQHPDGERYLLLSTDCTPLEQQAVSLIRALESYVQGENISGQQQLKNIGDEALLEIAHTVVDAIDQSVSHFTLLSEDVLREEMITFIGSLFNPLMTDSPVIQRRLQAVGLSAGESTELSGRLQPVWTDLWVTYEQRGVSRRNIITGILTGELHCAKVSLRELRWRLVKAYAKELFAAQERLRQWQQTVASWAESLKLKAVSNCLFGLSSQPFEHSLDAYGKAEGLSGLLGLMRKTYRKEQQTNDCLEPFREYALDLIHSSQQEKSPSQHVAQLLVNARSEGALQLLLELLEHCLIDRLSALKPAPRSVNPSFPAEIDTQIHSYYSDCGGQSVARIVFEAYDRGLKAIAITDHQCFDGIEQALAIGKLLSVHIIPAIELYTGIRRNGRVEQRRDVLVYFPDVRHFLNWWRQGLDAESWQLFNDGWNRKVNGGQWGDVPIRRVTGWAYAHGGVPVLAHPGLWSPEQFHEDGWSFDAFEQLFLETGLAGIEISHSRLPFDENTKRFIPLVKQFNQKHADRPIVFTTGTDSHTEHGIGRANLSKRAVAHIARAFALKGGPAGPAVRIKITDDLKALAAKITQQTSLYPLRQAVLSGEYGGFQAYDCPLAVQCTDVNQPSRTILAGIKEYRGRPVIIAVNIGRREQFAGKDWGALNLAKALTLQNTPEAVYQFKDLETGKHYESTGATLVTEGLHVGLYPNQTQFLLLSGDV